MQQQTPASPALLQELGDALYSALRERRTLAPLSERYALSVTPFKVFGKKPS